MAFPCASSAQRFCLHSQGAALPQALTWSSVPCSALGGETVLVTRIVPSIFRATGSFLSALISLSREVQAERGIGKKHCSFINKGMAPRWSQCKAREQGFEAPCLIFRQPEITCCRHLSLSMTTSWRLSCWDTTFSVLSVLKDAVHLLKGLM